MFQNTKCECGHQNPVGTLLCESCGKPMIEGEHNDVVEMRYDGVARRSQRTSPSLFDRMWAFFSSVKVAVYIIIITLISSMLGTIFPQENMFIQFDPSTYYRQTYGTLGHVYYCLGLSHTYESWWFIGLLVMIGISLVICSLDRVLPLYRALHKQNIPRHVQFLRRQRISYEGNIAQKEQAFIDNLIIALKKKRYRIRAIERVIFAEKNRFSRWGPYIIHIGLIVFLLAVLARNLPGFHMDEHIVFSEGEPKRIPNTSLYLKNERFIAEYYEKEQTPEHLRKIGKQLPKRFETKAVLYTATPPAGHDATGVPPLKEVARHSIAVNDPLHYKGLKVYQYDFDLTPVLRAVSPTLINVTTGERYGKFHLPMNASPSGHKFHVGEYMLQLKQTFMDFSIDDKGMPMSKSSIPNAPAFLFQIQGPKLPKEGASYFYFPKEIDKQTFQQDAINQRLFQGAVRLALKVESMNDVDIIQSQSYLNVRIDRAMPFIWMACGIVMVGLIIGFYWQHRRIWLRIENGQVILGAHTNKNWFGFRREVAFVLRAVNIQVDENELDKGRNG